MHWKLFPSQAPKQSPHRSDFDHSAPRASFHAKWGRRRKENERGEYYWFWGGGHIRHDQVGRQTVGKLLLSGENSF